ADAVITLQTCCASSTRTSEPRGPVLPDLHTHVHRPLRRNARRARACPAAAWSADEGVDALAGQERGVGWSFNVGAAPDDLVYAFGGVPLADLVHAHDPAVVVSPVVVLV